MFQIAIKEFKNFFNDLIGISFLISFFLLTGFFTWYFEGNILDFGYAELDIFFSIVPWFFIILNPALGMKLVGEEYEKKTINLLLVQNFSKIEIILGKLLGGIFLISICLLISIIYVISVGYLGNPPFNFDFSIIIGQYFGILLLNFVLLLVSFIGCFMAKKQSLGFILGLIFSFLIWEVPSLLEGISLFKILNLGDNSPLAHFNNITRGFLSYTDFGYFLGLILILFGLCIQLFKPSN